jgi:hypothetical protein
MSPQGKNKKMQPDLLDKITNFFREKGSDSLRERRVLLLCMGLSLLVWFIVKMSNSYESRGQLSITYRPPIGHVFAEAPLRSMPFKFSGTGWELLRMGIFRQRPSLEFRLSDAAKQVISRSDISQKIEEELKLNLLELGQDNIALRLDSLFSKRVKIELDTAINFENGYYFRDSATLSPDSVVVFGAPQLLDKISVVKTELLRMDCPEKDFSKTLKIINPQPGLMALSANMTEFTMPVEQYTEKTLLLPVTVLNTVVNAKDSVRLLPSTVELQCVVGISRFQEISARDFRVVAVIGNENAVNGATSTAPLTLVRQPSWVRSARISPQAVEYLIVQ